MEQGNVWLLVLIALVSFALAFIGATVGLVLGHLRLPLLIVYLGSPGAGAAMNLVVSSTGALAGSYRHARDGRVSWVGLAIILYVAVEMIWRGSLEVACAHVEPDVCGKGLIAVLGDLLS